MRMMKRLLASGFVCASVVCAMVAFAQDDLDNLLNDLESDSGKKPAVAAPAEAKPAEKKEETAEQEAGEAAEEKAPAKKTRSRKKKIILTQRAFFLACSQI